MERVEEKDNIGNKPAYDDTEEKLIAFQSSNIMNQMLPYGGSNQQRDENLNESVLGKRSNENSID